mgnify:CR=1 FL=1
MKKAILLAAIFFSFCTSTLLSEQLSAEQDAELYQQIMIWRGEEDISLISDSMEAEMVHLNLSSGEKCLPQNSAGLAGLFK